MKKVPPSTVSLRLNARDVTLHVSDLTGTTLLKKDSNNNNAINKMIYILILRQINILLTNTGVCKGGGLRADALRTGKVIWAVQVCEASYNCILT